MTTSLLCLRLNDGAELIASCEQSQDGITATKVLQLISMPDEASQSVRMAVVPFMPYTVGEFVFPFGSAIISVPSEDLANMHREKFGDIILAKAGKLIV